MTSPRFLSLLISSMFAVSLPSLAHQQAPTNVIFMIGDGMGPAMTTGYRYFIDNPTTKDVETTVFDDLLVGMASTYPDDDTVVTDSAAAATALATGVKSYNGAIAVDTHKQPLRTMLQQAKSQGMLTALVATSQINHATPASFAAHNESRRNYDAIANDYIDVKVDGKLPVDLLLGGGVQYFDRSDRNLVSEFKAAGYDYITDLAQLTTIRKPQTLGLFAPAGMDSAINSAEPLRLSKMANAALKVLDPKQGFFMMIEGSQIDWCAHSNDIVCAMHEMDDFAHAITTVKAYIDANPNTLLVVTADHSTGGVTLGRDGKYEWRTQVVKEFSKSGDYIAQQLASAADLSAEWSRYASTPLSKDELAQLVQAKTNSKDKNALAAAVKSIIDIRTNTGWTTGGHTAVDVQVFAYGKGAEQFAGHVDNTDIAKKLFEVIKHNATH